jgi:hypothetical protein
MALLSLADIGGYRCFDFDQCRDAGQALSARYATENPFPHIVIDDFLDIDLLRKVIVEFPDSSGQSCFMRDQEKLKFQYRPDQCHGAATRMLFAELNSRAFLQFLSELTGIAGLIPDPYHAGAGLHEIKSGGHLSIHADFPRHETMRIDRRLNLLIYLNEDWAPDFGGSLELWDREMRAAEQMILPVLGRAVIFNTDSDTFHGHPDPLTCPADRSRRSIATYYYTAPAGSRKRPGTRDKRDWRIFLHHLKADWLPPVLQRRRASGM